MKTEFPERLKNVSKYGDTKAEFDNRCKFYAENVTNGKQKNRFFRSCRYSLMGYNHKRKWDAEEKEWRLQIISKYFPNEVEEMLEYEREEIRINAKKKQMQEWKEKENNL